MRSARPCGKRSASTTSADAARPRCSRFSWAQVTARGLMSVATTRSTPRRNSTAASTPVPVPRSKAVSGADESACHGLGKWCLSDEIDVFAADRGEHTVAGVDVLAEGGNGHALQLPLVGTEHPVQLGQRDAHRSRRRPVGGLTGQPHIGGATQVQLVAIIEFDDQRTEQTGTIGDGATLRFECPRTAASAATVFAGSPPRRALWRLTRRSIACSS